MTEPTDAYSRMLHEALVHLGERQERWKLTHFLYKNPSSRSPSANKWLDFNSKTWASPKRVRKKSPGWTLWVQMYDALILQVAELILQGIWLTDIGPLGAIEKGQFLKQNLSGTAVPEWDDLIILKAWAVSDAGISFWSFWQSILILVIVVDYTDVSVLSLFLFCFFRTIEIEQLVGWLVGQLVDSRPWRLETFQSRHPRIQAFLPSMSMWRRCPVDQTQHVLRKDQQAGAFGCFQK